MPRNKRTHIIRYLSKKVAYVDKVKGIETANLIGYWPMNEAAGATADNYEGTAARDGTYHDVTLGQTGMGDGSTCPLFDGAASYTDMYTANLGAVMSTVEGTVAAWFKVFNVGVWTDGANGVVIYIASDGGNEISLIKNAVNNTFAFRHNDAAGKDRVYSLTPFSSTAWNHAAMTWSATGTAVKCYMNGIQVDGGLGVPGALVGNFNKVSVGAYNAANWQLHGWLAHVALWNKALTGPEVLSMATL